MIQWFSSLIIKEIYKGKLVNSSLVDIYVFIHPAKILFTLGCKHSYKNIIYVHLTFFCYSNFLICVFFLISGILGGMIVDKWGCRKSIIIGTTVMTIPCGLSCLSKDIATLIVLLGILCCNYLFCSSHLLIEALSLLLFSWQFTAVII